MKQRLEKLRAKLREAGCEAYVSFSPPANQYLTGFRGSASTVLVTESAALFQCDFRYAEQAEHQVSKAYTLQQVAGSMPQRAGETLRDLGAASAGFDPAVMVVQALAKFEAAFESETRALPGLLDGLRLIKDSREIDAIRRASHLAEGAMVATRDNLRAGMKEREFAADLEAEFKRRGASGPSFDAIALFGARSSLPHGMPGAKPLEPGDVVLIDCGCMLEGYASDLTRTYVFDRIPAAWFDEIYQVTLEAQLAALQAVKPGAACSEVDGVARRIIHDAGYGERFGHGLGHGVGIEVHEMPRLNKESEAVLEPGMVVTVEPGIYLPGRGGVRIEDLVVVTGNGCDVLTDSPKELRVLEA